MNAERMTPERIAEIEARHVHAPVDRAALIAGVHALLAERDTLSARVAELEEAARWRPASERPEVDAHIEIAFRFAEGDGGRALGSLWADGRWCTDDYEPGIVDAMPERVILGWRPLGPGPVASGGAE